MSDVSLSDGVSKQSEIVLLQTPRRTEGDGMENSDSATTLSINDKSFSLKATEPLQPNKMVHLIPKNSVLHVHVSKEPKYVLFSFSSLFFLPGMTIIIAFMFTYIIKNPCYSRSKLVSACFYGQISLLI